MYQNLGCFSWSILKLPSCLSAKASPSITPNIPLCNTLGDFNVLTSKNNVSIPPPLSETNCYMLWDTSLWFLPCHALKPPSWELALKSMPYRSYQPFQLSCTMTNVSLSALFSRPIILWRWPMGQITAWCKPWWT